MNNKILIVLVTFLCLSASSIAYSNTNDNDNKEKEEKEKLFEFKVSGFVKTDYWYDSRSVIAAREDLFLLFPDKEFLDVNGLDVNGDPSFNFSAITSRIAGHISGPDAFNAKTTGFIEADFSGVTNADINGFRLRHAYLKLDWEKFDLLFGQWWHPMFATEVVPTVVSLNTGAPFQPFIRNPQLSLTYKSGNFKTLVAAVAQRDNSSDGPKGASPDYIRTSAMPNFHLQFIYKKNNTTAGIAGDYKILRPQVVTDQLYKTAETIGSYAFMAYLRYNNNLLDVKGKAIYGQNLSEHLVMGGYAEHYINPETGYVKYTPLNHMMLWGNIVYGKKIQTGLFAGYAHNFGSDDIIVGNYYGRGQDIAYVYRVAPSLSFQSGSVRFCTELEYTAAAYGTPNEYGIVKDHSEISNIRLLFTAFYFF